MKISDTLRSSSRNRPAYFIAEIGANHNGSLDEAKRLIWLAAEAGADAAKFQHIRAADLGSWSGFDKFYESRLQTQHSVHALEAYRKAEVPLGWTKDLARECHSAGIEFITAPYSIQDIDFLAEHVDAFKVGSGDFSWVEKSQYLVDSGRPVLMACGASDLSLVAYVMENLKYSPGRVCLMQCNSSYVGGNSNVPYLNLRVLSSLQALWPEVCLGLSDHTKAVAIPIAARALGATVFERHFTDDNDREGADHLVALDAAGFREMVSAVRELESALGDGIKRIESNEFVAAMTQRRALRFSRDVKGGTVLQREDISVLRPWFEGCYLASEIELVVGRRLEQDASEDEEITPNMLSVSKKVD